MGARATVYGPQSFNDYVQQMNIIEDLITKRIDLIVLNPSQQQVIVPAVVKAREAGIPVVTIENKVESDAVLTYMGKHNFYGAYTGAKYVEEKINGNGKVAILEGEAGNPNAIQRRDGAVKGSSEYPRIKVAERQNAHQTEEGGLTVMENILLAHPDLAAVLCACDNIVFGAAQPAKNRGVRRVIVGFDSITEAMDAIIRLMPRLCSSQGKLLSQEKELACSHRLFERCREHFAKPFQETIDTRVMVVDKNNIRSFKGSFSVF